jgi:predicted nucleic acid-binding protein
MDFDRPLVFDACALINLHASGRMGDVLRSAPQPTLVTETVRALELLRTEALDALNPEGDRLGDLLASGLLNVVDFASDDEAGLFLDYAAAIGGDGEAASLAVAASRGFAVVTDDKKARRFAGWETPDIPLVFSLEVIEHWSRDREVAADELRAALESVRVNGRYKPSRSHPLYDWWLRSLDAERAR